VLHTEGTAQVSEWLNIFDNAKNLSFIRVDVKLAQLVRARDSCQWSRGRRFDSGKNSKNPRTQIYIDLSYIVPQASILNYYYKS